jgi:hypothetical protein
MMAYHLPLKPTTVQRRKCLFVPLDDRLRRPLPAPAKLQSHCAETAFETRFEIEGATITSSNGNWLRRPSVNLPWPRAVEAGQMPDVER